MALRTQLLGFLGSLGCSEVADEAIVEYAAGVIEAAVDDDEEIEEHLEHIDSLLAGACGERYELTTLEARYRQLTAIVEEARHKHAEPPSSSASSTPAAARNGQGHSGLPKQLGGLSLSGGDGKCSSSGSSRVGSSMRCQENTSPAGEPAATRAAPAAVQELLALCSGAVSQAFLQYALEHKFGGSAEALAAWLLDSSGAELEAAEAGWEDLCQRQAREQEEARLLKERNKQQILQKFDLRPVPQPKDPKKGAKPPALDAWTDKQEKQPKVRYLDGRVVSTKGERFIVEKTGEEWDGGSRGKVYTKGKRGKGFV